MGSLESPYTAWQERYPESGEMVLLRAASLQSEYELGDPLVIWQRLATLRPAGRGNLSTLASKR